MQPNLSKIMCLTYLLMVFYHPLVLGIHAAAHCFDSGHTEKVSHHHDHMGELEFSFHTHSDTQEQEQDQHLPLLVFQCVSPVSSPVNHLSAHILPQFPIVDEEASWVFLESNVPPPRELV